VALCRQAQHKITDALAPSAYRDSSRLDPLKSFVSTVTFGAPPTMEPSVVTHFHEMAHRDCFIESVPASTV